jgi:hypothetical protein
MVMENHCGGWFTMKYLESGVDNGDFLKCYNLFKKKWLKIIQFFFFFILVLKSHKKQKIKKCVEAHTFLSVDSKSKSMR